MHPDQLGQLHPFQMSLISLAHDVNLTTLQAMIIEKVSRPNPTIHGLCRALNWVRRIYDNDDYNLHVEENRPHFRSIALDFADELELEYPAGRIVYLIVGARYLRSHELCRKQYRQVSALISAMLDLTSLTLSENVPPPSELEMDGETSCFED